MTLPGRHPWVKSSYSSQDGGDCLEWSPGYARAQGGVPVRDSKTPDGPSLMFGTAAWAAFISRVRKGELST
ncbi:hypothetical protein HEK616_55660 [Streptomyces nigrescens]|uniref:DUF397 domain-containing protein n=2 Tax=Streptomyces TaxID=1883 RepID=A0ABM8A0D9_STRNI|nr:DUF397 domain-containing protein [Streptomyces nigrescens]MEE4421439.1 DUF397 domain-containing protein [Streptomyces sp. DSM 41528]BDM72079.1 hypothetical protein HEK616_55660 [Streptomyces nigrescens]